MFSLLKSRLLCAAALEPRAFTRLNGADFAGRVGTASNPRKIAPVILSNVLNGNMKIEFDCISRNAASKAMHAAAIVNAKNVQDMGVFVRPAILPDLPAIDGGKSEGLTVFKIAMFPDVRPHAVSDEAIRFTHRIRVSATVDHNELAKNIHSVYMKKHPLVIECMGDKAMSIVTHAIALFNQRVESHDMVAFVCLKSGTAPDGTEIAKMEFQLFERASHSI